MSVEKLIKDCEEVIAIHENKGAIVPSFIKPLLAVVKVQNKALVRIIGKCSDYRGWKLAEEAITETDKIAREGV